MECRKWCSNWNSFHFDLIEWQTHTKKIFENTFSCCQRTQRFPKINRYITQKTNKIRFDATITTSTRKSTFFCMFHLTRAQNIHLIITRQKKIWVTPTYNVHWTTFRIGHFYFAVSTSTIPVSSKISALSYLRITVSKSVKFNQFTFT